MKRDLFLSSLILSALVIYVCVLTAVVPWTGDDIKYLFSFADGGTLGSLKDIWTSQVAHWHEVNGRFIAHFLVQTVLVFVGRAGFTVLNALVYMALVFLLLKLCDRKFSDWKSTLAVCTLLVLALPTKFVPTCQIGYIWMFDIVLLFLLEWKKIVVRQEGAPKSAVLWLAPLSFLAGFSQEAIVIGVGFALAVYALRNLRSLGAAGWVMLISFGAGAQLLCLSPANFGRTAEEHGTVGNLGELAVSMVKFFLYQRVTYILLLLAAYLMIVRKIDFRSLYRVSPFLWNAWAALIVFNLLVGVFGNRQLFGAEIMAAMLVLKTVAAYVPGGIRVPQVLITACAAGLMVFNTAAAFHSRNIYQTVVRGFEESADGKVSCKLGFFDRHYRESGPSDAWSWYVTSTVDKLLHLEGKAEGKTLVIE